MNKETKQTNKRVNISNEKGITWKKTDKQHPTIDIGFAKDTVWIIVQLKNIRYELQHLYTKPQALVTLASDTIYLLEQLTEVVILSPLPLEVSSLSSLGF